MENYGLTHPEEGYAQPLRYYLTVTKHGLELHFTERAAKFLSDVLQKQQARGFLPKDFILPDQKKWGMCGVLVTKGQSLLPIQVSNNERMFVVQVPSNDRSKLEAVAETLSIVFSFEYFFPHQVIRKEDVTADRVQLFSLETFFSADPVPHGASLSFSVSPTAARFLEKHSAGTPIPRARREMKKHWLTFSGKKERESKFLDGAFIAHLRDYGMLSLATVGSCACMGGIPEKLEDGVGFAIDSHNVDYTPQQINLLVGLACVWDWVRKSLEKKAA